MKTTFGTWLIALAICALAIPAEAVEPTTAGAAVTVTDVAFAASGNFSGTVVDEVGKPLSNVPVRILHQQKIVATAKTNGKGGYSVKGLRSGLHIVQTPNKSQACRFWTAKTAPPLAKRSLVLASEQTVLRGQGGGGLNFGAILPMAAFAATTAVTIASTTGNDDTAAVGITAPASP